jgi:hypothetical protein
VDTREIVYKKMPDRICSNQYGITARFTDSICHYLVFTGDKYITSKGIKIGDPIRKAIKRYGRKYMGRTYPYPMKKYGIFIEGKSIRLGFFNLVYFKHGVSFVLDNKSEIITKITIFEPDRSKIYYPGKKFKFTNKGIKERE